MYVLQYRYSLFVVFAPCFRDCPASENDDGPRKFSKLEAFLSTNKAENHIPTFGPRERDADGAADCDPDGEGRECKVFGCSNRAVQNVGVCPMHTKRWEERCSNRAVYITCARKRETSTWATR